MTTIYADGVFDLTHYGHHKLLRRAKELGEKLVVGVHRDNDVETYKRKPILNYYERVQNISCLEFIYKIVPGPLIITEAFLNEHNIDMVVHAHEIKDEERYREMYKVPNDLGKFKRLDYSSEISTTDIINRIETSSKQVSPTPGRRRSWMLYHPNPTSLT
tara:strand:- start:81 stop:560 length:480 start_codon:yes stop_codon:yes gene_type:complete